jgi:ubiquitin C-terminal hydrolase
VVFVEDLAPEEMQVSMPVDFCLSCLSLFLSSLLIYKHESTISFLSLNPNALLQGIIAAGIPMGLTNLENTCYMNASLQVKIPSKYRVKGILN